MCSWTFSNDSWDNFGPPDTQILYVIGVCQMVLEQNKPCFPISYTKSTF